MQQLLQSLADGRIILEEIPVPSPASTSVLIQTRKSLISSGTERMLVEFGRAGWLEKIRQQPEKVQQVLAKVRTDGVATTLEAVRSKLEQPIPLGYCNAGRVVETGAHAAEYVKGQRVVSNGSHAEYVTVGRNLCAHIPESVSDDEAVFAPLVAIALQGVRLANPSIGERICVIGLGLIGLVAVQLLRANGCKVLAFDPDPSKSELAKRFGADVLSLQAGEDVLKSAERFSAGQGVDAVLIAAATDSDEPMRQAAQMCRQRGRVVLIGVTGLNLNRADFYRKEISFQVSCSYGPGRYDDAYEDRGLDYPFGLVRWTEQRNFQAALQLMEGRQLDLLPLISHRFEFAGAGAAYDLLADRSQRSLGIMLEYPNQDSAAAISRTLPLGSSNSVAGSKAAVVAFVGAGNYAGRVLIPAFRAGGARLQSVVSANGINAARYGRKFGFALASSDIDSVLRSPEVDAVVIATRHDTHASLVRRALAAGKHVFVEKPLALSIADVDAVERAMTLPSPSSRILMIGFNRRFAPLTIQMKSLLDVLREPKTLVVTVNAGAVPAGHWTLEAAGGGRIIGEACHFIDLLRFLAACPIVACTARRTGSAACRSADPSVSIMLSFADGTSGTIHYLTNGHASYPKERIEAFASGRVLQLDNFRRLRGFGFPHFQSQRAWRQDKGQSWCASAFLRAIETGQGPPIPLEEILEVSRAAILASEASQH